MFLALSCICSDVMILLCKGMLKLSNNRYYPYFRELSSEMLPILTEDLCYMLENIDEDSFSDYVNKYFNKKILSDYFCDKTESEIDLMSEFEKDFDFGRIPESHEIYEAFREMVDETLQAYYEATCPPKPSRWQKVKSFLSNVFSYLLRFLGIVLIILSFPILLILQIFRRKEPAGSQKCERERDRQRETLDNIIMNNAMTAVSEAIQDSFANRLRRIQRERDISASKIAKASAISNASFSKYLSEQNLPDKNTVIRLLIGCQLSMEESTELLNSVGYEWLNCETDNVIRQYIDNRIFDIEKLNDDLIHHGLCDLMKKRKFMGKGNTNNTEEKSFSELLIEYQERAGLTSEECSEKIDVSPRCWAQYRSAERHPERSKLLKIAVILKCSRQETEALLNSCEFHLISSDMTEQIMMQAIEKKVYDLNKISEIIDKSQKAERS
ncbi:hypothetical protein SAMN02910447_00619 [Ruminococcus sp. YE71]|nr:hypothetical protein SAMN02910446_00618 [Ruminococcus sp. YE78]SFW17196.1 hypothetical protein SAMN02910447_00619 [Ruminococcus sp. YE71]